MILWFVSADFVLNQFCFNKVLFIGSYLDSTTTQLEDLFGVFTEEEI